MACAGESVGRGVVSFVGYDRLHAVAIDETGVTAYELEAVTTHLSASVRSVVLGFGFMLLGKCIQIRICIVFRLENEGERRG